MLQDLEFLTGSAETKLLAFLLELTTEKFKAYCFRDDVPPDAESVIVELAAATYYKTQTCGRVKSISEGDSFVTYSDAARTVFDNHAAILQRWRKLGAV